MLGAMFLLAGMSKLSRAENSETIVGQWTNQHPIVMAFVCLTELLVGVSLLRGLLPVYSGSIALALLVAFSCVLIREMREGSSVSCGCIGSFGGHETIDPQFSIKMALMRNILAIAASIVLILFTPASVGETR